MRSTPRIFGRHVLCTVAFTLSLSGCLELARDPAGESAPAKVESAKAACQLGSAPQALFTFKTTDIAAGMPESGIFSSLRLTSNGTLYAALTAGAASLDEAYHLVYRSRDGGATWTEIYRYHNASEYVLLSGFAVSDDGRIAVAAENYTAAANYSARLMYSANDGATWSTSDYQEAGNPTTIDNLQFAPDGTLHGFGSYQTGGNWRIGVWRFSGGTPTLLANLTDGSYSDAVTYGTNGKLALDSAGRGYMAFSINAGSGYGTRLIRSTDSTWNTWEIAGKTAAEGLPAGFVQEMSYSSAFSTPTGKILYSTMTTDAGWTERGYALRSFSAFGPTTIASSTPITYSTAGLGGYILAIAGSGARDEIVTVGYEDAVTAAGAGARRFAKVSRDDGVTWSSLLDTALGAGYDWNTYTSGVFDKSGNLFLIQATKANADNYSTYTIEKLPCQ